MFFEGKKILVTGSTGLIGYNLVCRLLNEGVSELYATGRSIKKLSSTFEDYNKRKELILLEHDAAKPLPNCIRDLDYIFHAAGPMERDIVMNRPVDVILPNINGSVNCMEFLKEQQKETGKKGRIILFSSVTVYSNPTNEDYVATEDVTKYAISLDAPSACYAESKRMTEVIAKSYVKQYGVDAVIARFSTVYGPTRNIPDTAFYEFVKKSIAGEDITVNSNAAPRRDNIYVDDAIEGLLCIAWKGETGEAYNISSGGEKGNYAAVDEIAKLAAKAAGKGTKVIYEISDSQRKCGVSLDNCKLRSLGWSLHYSIENAISETIKKLEKNKHE